MIGIGISLAMSESLLAGSLRDCCVCVYVCEWCVRCVCVVWVCVCTCMCAPAVEEGSC